MMNRLELLQEFERLHTENIENCDRGCDWCTYLEICDIVGQLLDKKREGELTKQEDCRKCICAVCQEEFGTDPFTCAHSDCQWCEGGQYLNTCGVYIKKGGTYGT